MRSSPGDLVISYLGTCLKVGYPKALPGFEGIDRLVEGQLDNFSCCAGDLARDLGKIWDDIISRAFPEGVVGKCLQCGRMASTRFQR